MTLLGNASQGTIRGEMPAVVLTCFGTSFSLTLLRCCIGIVRPVFGAYPSTPVQPVPGHETSWHGCFDERYEGTGEQCAVLLGLGLGQSQWRGRDIYVLRRRCQEANHIAMGYATIGTPRADEHAARVEWGNRGVFGASCTTNRCARRGHVSPVIS